MGRGSAWSGSGLSDVEGSCECGDEPPGSIKCGEFLIVAVELADLKVWELNDDVFVTESFVYRVAVTDSVGTAGTPVTAQ